MEIIRLKRLFVVTHGHWKASLLAARFVPGTAGTRKCYLRPVRACRCCEPVTRDLPCRTPFQSLRKERLIMSSGGVVMFDADMQVDKPNFGVLFGFCSFRVT